MEGGDAGGAGGTTAGAGGGVTEGAGVGTGAAAGAGGGVTGGAGGVIAGTGVGAATGAGAGLAGLMGGGGVTPGAGTPGTDGTGSKFSSSASGIPSANEGAKCAIIKAAVHATAAAIVPILIPRTPSSICGPVLCELNPTQLLFSYSTLEALSWVHFRA
jgi:hypothetical protein